MATPYRAGPFEPVGLYDAPWTAVTQALEGTLSWRSFTSTMFGGGNSLSPEQRESYIKRFKDSVGGPGVVGAAIDVATNPFVLAGFLLSPAGVTALRRGGGRIFGDYLQKTAVPWILKTGNQMVDGTAGGAALREVMKEVHDKLLEFSGGNAAKGLRGIGALEERLVADLGVPLKHWNNPSRIKDQATRDRVQRVRMAILGSLGGLDQTVVMGRPSWIPKAYQQVPDASYPGGFRNIEITDQGELKRIRDAVLEDASERSRMPLTSRERTHGIHWSGRANWYNVVTSRSRYYVELPADVLERQAWVKPGTFEAILDGMPSARAFRDGIRDHTVERFRVLFADEEKVPTFQALRRAMARGEDLAGLVDEQKVLRMWSGLQSNDLVGRMPDGPDDFVTSLLSRSTRRDLIQGELGQEEFLEAVRRGFASTVRLDTYFPRVARDFYAAEKVGGNPWELRKLDEGSFRMDARGQRIERVASGRSHPYETAQGVYHWEDMEEFGRLFDGNLVEGFEAARQTQGDILRRAMEKAEPGAVALERLDLTRALRKWEGQTAKDYALFVAPVREAVLRDQERMLANEALISRIDSRHPRGFDGVGFRNPAADNIMRNYNKVFRADDPVVAPGGWSNAHVLNQTEEVLRINMGDRAADLFRGTVVPAAMGNNHHRYVATEWMVKNTQAVAEKMGRAKWVKEVFGEDFAHRLADYAKLEPQNLAPGWQRNAAGWIYSSTLGANMASVLLNITQPFLHLGVWVGAGNVGRAYKDAVGDLTKYFRARTAQYGVRPITSEQRRELVEKAGVRYFEETGLLGEVLEDLDRLAFQEGFRSGGGRFRYWTQELPLKPFEKGEWLNRLVAAHATEQTYRSTGRAVRDAGGALTDDFQADVVRMVQESQFGSGPMNTPAIFMKSGSLLRSPLMRQFMTFTLRTPLAFLEAQKIGNRGFVDFLTRDTVRALGLGAMFYEVGKNVGVDTENVGLVTAITDFWGGEQIMDRNAGFPLLTPPVVDIGLNAIRGAFGEETELLADAMARLVPAGVAWKRALNQVPSLKGSVVDIAGMAGAMQRQYADWGNPREDGAIPIFKGDGSLVEFQNPVTVILKGLGVPLESHREAGNFDRYLQKNRDRIVEMRREAMNAYLSNDPARGERIAAQFEQEFGIPLTWTKAQLRSRVQGRTITRTERMMDRMPRDVRHMYQEMVAQQAGRMAVGEEALRQGQTAVKRRKIDPGYGHPTVSAEALRGLRQRMAELQEQQQAGQQFLPFEPF